MWGILSHHVLLVYVLLIFFIPFFLCITASLLVHDLMGKVSESRTRAPRELIFIDAVNFTSVWICTLHSDDRACMWDSGVTLGRALNLDMYRSTNYWWVPYAVRGSLREKIKWRYEKDNEFCLLKFCHRCGERIYSAPTYLPDYDSNIL